ncbi:MAG: hypothetical protein GWO24_15630, partial [Akkermansiaceae bacterium]|nr:hypothetical protein [Akkermansiaceae bacterium]
MNLSPNELRIFSILHHFNDELEKIASFRSHPAYLRGRMKGIGMKVKQIGEEVGGLKKSVPYWERRKARKGATAALE